MAREAWSDRSAESRKQTLSRFAILYGVITLGAIAMSWYPVALIAGVLTVGLVIGMTTIAEDPPPREKPEWMEGIELPSEREADEPGS